MARLTPKQRVLRKYRRAMCDQSLGGGWAIWIPSKYYRAGSDRISDLSPTPRLAWADADIKIRATSTRGVTK